MSLSLLRSSPIHPVLPTPMSFAELWSHQEPVTEHYFTYNRLGQPDRPAEPFLRVQVAV